jgi:hypothetical protein
MNPLQRSSLGIEIDQVLATSDTLPSLFTGHDQWGCSYLVARASADECTITWLCAPISELALRCVAEGRAEPGDALRHSSNGAVARVRVARSNQTAVEETTELCRELRDEDLVGVGAGVRLPLLAGRPWREAS